MRVVLNQTKKGVPAWCARSMKAVAAVKNSCPQSASAPGSAGRCLFDPLSALPSSTHASTPRGPELFPEFGILRIIVGLGLLSA